MPRQRRACVPGGLCRRNQRIRRFELSIRGTFRRRADQRTDTQLLAQRFSELRVLGLLQDEADPHRMILTAAGYRLPPCAVMT